MKLDVISDPGHAWAKVSIRLLDRLNLLDVITSYSYIRGEFAYLEEDLDLGELMRAAQAAGIPLTFRERVARERRSRVREYDQYTPGRAREKLLCNSE
jgi:hypothetical protein